MSTMSSLRMRTLAERAISDYIDFKPGDKVVERVVRKAYDNLTDLVKRFPERTNYHRIILGGKTFHEKKINIWIECAVKKLAEIDPDSGIKVEPYTFSNLGDPFYMGPEDMIEQKGIRFKA